MPAIFVRGAAGAQFAEVTELDRAKQRIETDKGWINYDILVLAPGVEYDYASIGVNDTKTKEYLNEKFPAGFVSINEQQAIIKQLQRFKSGLFVLTAPQGIYRCAASPYERACLIAGFFKRKISPKPHKCYFIATLCNLKFERNSHKRFKAVF